MFRRIARICDFVLAKSKTFVQPLSPMNSSPINSPLFKGETEARALLASAKTIPAIKLLRAENGITFYEAKLLCDKWQDESPEREAQRKRFEEIRAKNQEEHEKRIAEINREAEDFHRNNRVVPTILLRYLIDAADLAFKAGGNKDSKIIEDARRILGE